MWGRPARQCRKAEHGEPGSWVRTEEDRHQLGKGSHQAQGRGDEGALGGFSGAEDEPCAFWFKHSSSPYYLCGLGTREPQLSLLAAVKSLDHHHRHHHPKA